MTGATGEAAWLTEIRGQSRQSRQRLAGVMAGTTGASNDTAEDGVEEE
jgi:hypothetical protein